MFKICRKLSYLEINL